MPNSLPRRIAVISTLLALASTPASMRRAHANGAFPDSQSILLPADRPNEIVLGTNFGLITSVDGGQTWTWACEQDTSSGGRLYQSGPAPLDRTFAIATLGLVYTDDGACSWKTTGGAVSTASAVDTFPDATNPNRVMVIVGPPVNQPSGGVYKIYESSDAGATFGTLRFTAPAGDLLTGVEIARSNPQIVYATMAAGGGPYTPALLRSSDGGATWQTIDLSPTLGTSTIRLIAIDPQDPDKLFLRNSAMAGESLAVSSDGGAHFTTPLDVPGGILTSFVRMPSGTLLLAGVNGTTNVLFRSTDGGATFTQSDAPALRALAQRNGRLYGSANNMDDNPALAFALGESTDEGTTWTPMMTYDQVQAIAGCLKAACQDDCQAKADLGLWDSAMCAADAMPRPVEGSTDAGANAADARADGSSAADGAPDGHGGGGSGCACRTAAGDGDHRAPGIAVSVMLALALARFRRKSRASR